MAGAERRTGRLTPRPLPRREALSAEARGHGLLWAEAGWLTLAAVAIHLGETQSLGTQTRSERELQTSNKAVLWDLDGTLVDSAEYHWIAWRDTLAGEGVAITYDQFLASFGQKNDRILGGWLPGTPSPETIRRIGDAKEAEYRRLAEARGLTPLPGATEWVARLKGDGWRQAIASSAPRQNVEVMLHALGMRASFDAVTSAEDVTAGKPDPEVFVAAASRVNLPPARCIVVEDAAAGIEAARRAGMRCVGVSRTERLAADVSVGSLVELPPDTFERLLVRS